MKSHIFASFPSCERNAAGVSSSVVP